MVFIKRFILMLQFMTTIPIPARLNVTQEDFGKGLVFAPVIGLTIGGMLAVSWYLLIQVFSPAITAVMTVIVYILLTGGLHLDGLADTADGIFSNRPRERILDIMRDSRIGTNGVLALVAVLLLDIMLISGINGEQTIKSLLLMPVAGRIGSLVGAGMSEYARQGEGLGRSFVEYCGPVQVIIGLIVSLAIFLGLLGKYAVIFVLPILMAFALSRFLGRKIGGVTGDILGAVCELNQVIFLIAICVIFK